MPKPLPQNLFKTLRAFKRVFLYRYVAVVTETGGGVGAQLRKVCGLGRPTASPEMVLLDLGQGGALYKLRSVEPTA